MLTNVRRGTGEAVPSRSDAVRVLRTEVFPGFTVFFVARHAALAGGEDFYASDGEEYLNRHHVPDVVRHDVADQEINVSGRIGPAGDVAAGVEGVSVDRARVGGLDLHPPAMAAGIEDEVVAVALSPGLGHAVTEAGGFVEESGFGNLAATLGREMHGGWRGAVARRGGGLS